MLSLARITLRERLPQIQSSSRYAKRGFAEVVSSSTGEAEAASTLRAVDWRKERVPVKEDHGLYGFFRRKEPKSGEELEGDDKYEVVETPESMQTLSGRGWKAKEIRQKSFKDLHMLWYVLLRERNLLATQKEESRRMGVEEKGYQANRTKLYHVRKSMARIKQVLNERRIAYEAAYDVASTEHEAFHNAAVLQHLKHLERQKGKSDKLIALEIAEATKQESLAQESKSVHPNTQRERAGETAAAGLFGDTKRI